MERRNFLATGLLVGLTAPVTIFAQSSLPSPRGPLQPFYIPPSSKPLEPRPDGSNGRVKVRSSQTNLQFSCVDGVMAAKTMGPPPHVHKELDEIMFVQEGTVSVLVGTTVYQVEAGGWHLRPHGIVHTYWNATDKAVRFIDMYFNQDFENFLEEMFEKLIPDLLKRGVPLTSKEATGKINALYARYGITMFDDQRQPIVEKYGLKG